ncbi:hypothetical protein AB0F25_20460 [Streptomyces wedmorensis]|uniref:hypothetical protein n=1 Tax=Streptomyces wedmorensis TaxID=43759 RepID=UPI00343CDA22
MEAGPRDREQHDAALDDPMADVTGDAPGHPTDDTSIVASGLSPDGPDDAVGSSVEVDADEVEVELRPQRRLRIWQLAPIVALAALGSLMFAFPLAFGSGDGGAVVAMLGLLISSCAAGWGMMAARKVGYTWPGLPQRGSGERPDWRVLALYVTTIVALVALAVWRVARLR